MNKLGRFSVVRYVPKAAYEVVWYYVNFSNVRFFLVYQGKVVRACRITDIPCMGHIVTTFQTKDKPRCVLTRAHWVFWQ